MHRICYHGLHIVISNIKIWTIYLICCLQDLCSEKPRVLLDHEIVTPSHDLNISIYISFKIQLTDQSGSYCHQVHIFHGLTQGWVIISLVITRQPRGSQVATTDCPNIQYKCTNEVHVQSNLDVIIQSKMIPQLWLVRSRHAINRTCRDTRLSHNIFSFSKCTYTLYLNRPPCSVEEYMFFIW
jgi:hypothetical protein